MANIVKDTSFIGFSFAGRHSSEFNLYRVSTGSRYQEDLVPVSSDSTEEIIGGDGAYYFGTRKEPLELPLSVAFDNITEAQFRQMRAWLSSEETQPIIFDERPYKIYYGKVNGAPHLEYICFKEKGKRIYKGEGTINFICYYPYAKCPFAFGREYNSEFDYQTIIPYVVNIFDNTFSGEENGRLWAALEGTVEQILSGKLDNTYEEFKRDWIEAVEDTCGADIAKFIEEEMDLKIGEWWESFSSYDGWGTRVIRYGPEMSHNNTVQIYNFGDIPMDFILYIEKNAGFFEETVTLDVDSVYSFGISCSNSELDVNGNPTSEEEKLIASKSGTIIINTKTNLISFRYTEQETGIEKEIPAYCLLKDGKLFKIPVGEAWLSYTGVENFTVEYDYLYY